MGTNKRTVVVAGAQGVIGRAAAEHFSTEPHTAVCGISRRPVEGLEDVRPIAADLLNPEDAGGKLAALTDVTHVAFAAHVEKDAPGERGAVNVAPLRNVMDAVESVAPGLRHVKIYAGRQVHLDDGEPARVLADRDREAAVADPDGAHRRQDHANSCGR